MRKSSRAAPGTLAVICTPAAVVPGLIAELGALGTRAAIVLSAGLDSAQRKAMLDAARPYLLRILGPNCIGMLSPHKGLNASFAHVTAAPGELAFVSLHEFFALGEPEVLLRDDHPRQAWK